MAINSVQINIENPKQVLFKSKNEYVSYLDAQVPVGTEDKVHPLPPQGHLIHDDFKSAFKYYFEDIKYDFKSLKNSLNGTANDHQIGKLNDMGMVTAGVLIATYLASQTPNKKARIMEYVGLGAFLTAMAVYPKLMINAPAKLMHGYDIDKQFIDDQGRKKSVMQDSNYVPYDMYLGEIPEEDITKIGDKMGIPRDIVNRNDVIREQMRKIATQNNTLWMLTAGVTPALAALLCCGLENFVIPPLLEMSSIAKYDIAISKALKKTSQMNLNVDSISDNGLSKKVKHLLSGFKDKELPKEEFEKLVKLFDEDLHSNTTEGIREDLTRLLRMGANPGTESVVVDEKIINEALVSSKNVISRNREALSEILVPTKEEFDLIIKQHISSDANAANQMTISAENVEKINAELRKLINSKINSAPNDIPKDFLHSQKNLVVDNILKEMQAKKSNFVSEENIKKITDFAKVMGEFKDNKRILQKCESFNIEFANDTLIANSYNKFEKTLLKELNIKFSDLRKMRESEAYTKEILDKKLIELVSNEAKFKKAMQNLGKAVSDMEVKLHGKDEAKSRFLNLFNSIENNYNNTAKRLSEIGDFDSTINRLVKQNVDTLDNNIKTREELIDLLDGTTPNKNKNIFDNGKEFWHLPEDKRIEYVTSNANGAGSSKNLEISRMVERYQGAKNSYNRVLHTLDVYKRSLEPEKFGGAIAGKDSEYAKAVIDKIKESLLNASSADHVMKLKTTNNPELYRDIMYSGWAGESGEFYSTKQKGVLTDATKEALGKNNSIVKGNVLDRLQYYISRFRNVVGSNTLDFTKPHHILNPYILNDYTQAERTRVSFFNLIGQTPVDMVKGAAGRKYATQKWVRIVSAIVGGVFGTALLSQLMFGKLSNPQNLKKQVSNDTNNK